MGRKELGRKVGMEKKGMVEKVVEMKEKVRNGGES